MLRCVCAVRLVGQPRNALIVEPWPETTLYRHNPCTWHARRFTSSTTSEESSGSKSSTPPWKKLASLAAGVVIGGIIVTNDWHDTIGRGLIRASRAQQTGVVRGLLYAGMPAAYVTPEGCNALHFAARLDSAEIVGALIEAGASLGRPVDSSGSPCAIGTPLHVAVRYEMLENARLLVAAGSPLDACDDEGNGALHLAVMASNDDNAAALVGVLIGAHAPIDAVNTEGFAALHLAAREGRTDIVRQLVEAGASLSVKTKEGDTALHLAAMYGQHDVVRLLLAAGVPVDSVESQAGKTSLQLAATAGYPDVVRLLLACGASVDHRDGKGQTPLHDVACSPWGEFLDVAEILLDAHASVDARDALGRTPLDLATQWNYLQVAQLVSAKVQH